MKSKAKSSKTTKAAPTASAVAAAATESATPPCKYLTVRVPFNVFEKYKAVSLQHGITIEHLAEHAVRVLTEIEDWDSANVPGAPDDATCLDTCVEEAREEAAKLKAANTVFFADKPQTERRTRYSVVLDPAAEEALLDQAAVWHVSPAALIGSLASFQAIEFAEDESDILDLYQIQALTYQLHGCRIPADEPKPTVALENAA